MRKTLYAMSLLALLGTGCQLPALSLGKNPQAAAPHWEGIYDGLSRWDCLLPACPARVAVFRFDQEKFAFSLKHSGEPATVEGWARRFPEAVFAANGVFFDENGFPTGLFISEGKRIGSHEYDADQSGLLVASPGFEIYSSAKGVPAREKIAEAAQNFPLLIRDGKAASKFKDERPSRRTFVGSDGDGNAYIGLVPEGGMTFRDLADYLVSMPVKWKNVLNLDGGTSTGFVANVGKRSESVNSFVQVPNAIIVEKK